MTLPALAKSPRAAASSLTGPPVPMAAPESATPEISVPVQKRQVPVAVAKRPVASKPAASADLSLDAVLDLPINPNPESSDSQNGELPTRTTKADSASIRTDSAQTASSPMHGLPSMLTVKEAGEKETNEAEAVELELKYNRPEPGKASSLAAAKSAPADSSTQASEPIVNLAAVGSGLTSKKMSTTNQPKLVAQSTPSRSMNTKNAPTPGTAPINQTKLNPMTANQGGKIHLSKAPDNQKLSAKPGEKKQAKPVLMTLNLNKRLWLDTDAIPWPDGDLSLPVSMLAKLFDMNTETDDTQQTMTLNDDINQQSIIIDWKNQAIQSGTEKWASFKHPITHVQNGLVVDEDVYIDREIIEQLLKAKLTIDMDNAVVGVDTDKNLRILGKAEIDPVADESEIPVDIDFPNEIHGLVEKFSIASTQNSNYQNAYHEGNSVLVPGSGRESLGINISSVTAGVSGTVMGQPYFIRPTLMRYNDQTRLQQLEWGIHHDWERNRLTLGSVNAGLTPLVAPTLPVWGLNYASRDNAMFPFSLQQTLGKSEASYSAFTGRIAPRFTPMNPNQDLPLWMPQSNKWLAGGRYLYGVTDRLTVGVSAVSDHIFGAPKTFYPFLDPFSIDLNGFTSAPRDANYLTGRSMGLSMRYRLSPKWLVSGEVGGSMLQILPGSRLPSDGNLLSSAFKTGLLYQAANWRGEAELFRYAPNYYTPSGDFSNTLANRQGVGFGLSGHLPGWLNTNYNMHLDHYQTNLDESIPGGLVHANHWQGNFSRSISKYLDINSNLNWSQGSNTNRHFIQRLSDVGMKAHLPYGMLGEVHVNRLLSNTLMMPARYPGWVNYTNRNVRYENNLLETSLSIPIPDLPPLGLSHMSVKVAHISSTFYDAMRAQGEFTYKNLYFEPLIQMSYGDKPQIQNRMGLKVGVQMKNGSRVGLSYYHNSSFFRSNSGADLQSKVYQHAFYMDFNNVWGSVGNRWKSLGANADNSGNLVGMLYADFDRNGKRDLNEPGIPQVKLVVDKQKTLVSDAQGRFTAEGLNPGFHTVAVMPENLPILLNPPASTYRVHIRDPKTYQFDIGLKTQGAQLSGTLSIRSVQNKPMHPGSIPLVLLAPNGKPIAYTLTESNGTYQFQDIAAGKYRMELAKRIQDGGRYKTLEKPAPIDIPVPTSYMTPVSQKELNWRLLKI